MHSHRFLPFLIFVAFISTILAANERPNLLLIVSDDQGYGDLSLHGNTVIETPNLDRLGENSVRFDHFHTTPVCATTRASLLTGKNHHTVGVWGVHEGKDYLALDEKTIADILSEHGYRTGFIGKWHSGRSPAWMPWNRGFDQAYVSSLYKHKNTPISHNGKAIHLKGWADESFTDLAIQFIDRKEKKPFFLMLSMLTPHGPIEAPEEYVNKYLKKGLSLHFSKLNGMIEFMDKNIGRLLSHLDESGMRDNTVIVFISDNGSTKKTENGVLTDEEWDLRRPLGLRGNKGNIYENAMRVPCFIHWQNKIKPAIIKSFTDVTDLFPTILDLAQVKQKKDPSVTGKSWLPFLSGKQTQWPEAREFFRPYWTAFWKEGWDKQGPFPEKSAMKYPNQINAWIQEPYKLIFYRGRYKLFHLKEDPQENKDLSKQFPKLVESLSQKMKQAYLKMHSDKDTYTQPRFHIGHSEYDLCERVGLNLRGSEIPFCTGTSATGNVIIQSHNSANWKAVGDSQTIPVDVTESGTFRVLLDLSKPTNEVQYSLSIGDSSIQRSLKKENGQWTLGNIKLKAGQQDLTLAIESMPQGVPIAFNKLNHILFKKIISSQP